MAKAKRVFEVAKELGVASKAIVAKCQAEGVPGITNHMSTVKIGLEQTIRQWFSESADTEQAAATAVETAEPVDLTKARKARKRRASASRAKEQDEESQTSSSSTAVLEPPPDTSSQAASGSQGSQEDVSTQQIAADETASVEGQATAAGVDDASRIDSVTQPQSLTPPSPQPEGGSISEQEETSQDGQPVQPVGKPNVPDRPKVIKPVGEQLDKPQEATLKGPKVVRIERPDVVQAPPPRRSPPPPRTGGPAGGASDHQDTNQRDSGYGPRGGDRSRAAGKTSDRAARPAAKRRSLSTRRGRSAEAVPAGPSKFSEQDLIELDARLTRSSGFVKQRRTNLKKKSSPTLTASSPAVTGGKVEIQEPITIKALSAATGIKSTDVIKYLFQKGVMATINSFIATEAAMEVALEYEIELEVKEQQTAEQLVVEEFESRTEVDVRPRPPVATVMGHVDHGKTSLLDRIRASDIATHEAGGITQHVGAYRVTIQGHDNEEKTVVFLDTPGHEAFTSMRSRGTGMTDLVVLVIAADDGVMPQTIESINHASAAGVPIIVALNKIDRPDATDEKIQKIYGQLAEHGLNPVEWGGETEVIKVSAIEGTGVKDLIEMLDYQAELLDLKADYGGSARGTVVEAEMQPGRGPVARVLVQQGRLNVGDFIVIGRSFGRVRDLTDDRSRSIKDAFPATPVELSGIDQIPNAGDKFYVTDTLQKAEEVANQYREKERNAQLANKAKVTLENFVDNLAVDTDRELRVVLKADVQGSIDVLRKSVTEVGNEEVSVKVLHAAVGGITESDVLLADASDAVVIGFHVVASPHVRDLAEQRGVEIRVYRVIYELIDEIKRALEGMLEPETTEQVLGEAEVRQVFKISKIGMVAGSIVLDGAIQRSGLVRVVRDGVVVTQKREIESLRRVKEDVREVRAGTECGIRLVGFDDIKPGDKIQCYNIKMVERKLA